MKVRCPHCKHVFGVDTQRGAQTCPACAKTLLLPRFFGDKKPAEVNRAVLQREILKRRRASAGGGLPPAGMIFAKRPTRLFFIIAVLVVIGGLLIQRLRQPVDLTESARITLALENMETLGIALQRFYHHCGRYPTPEEGLAALILNPGVDGWNGPYILGLRPDPWGRQFQYRLDNGNPVISSFGADGMAGTEKDLTVRPVPEHATVGDPGVIRVTP